ncbi:MAG TPA: tryptophan synthase subunit alpha [Candidatus Xenobia bacterium]|jgi:tryptophan synthase alpha chain
MRYEAMFKALEARHEGAFVPFLVLGDPDVETSRRLLEAVVAGGADAVELGIPFSDPIADGPTVQAGDVRALSAGVRPADCWKLIAGLRAAHPDLPIGLLVYANLVFTRGIDYFYSQAAEAGVDSVVVADVPVMEAQPFVEAAHRHAVAPVLIAPPNASAATLEQVARLSSAYIYVQGRSGVTGTETAAAPPSQAIQRLTALGGPRCLVGFGISQPEHVQAALQGGAAGAISGSAVVDRVARDPGSIEGFVRSMKAATRR